MKTNEIFRLIDDKDLLDKIYQFSYRRCNSSFEAEELCSEIILALISMVRKNADIQNFYAYIWSVARKVYADFSEKRNIGRRISGIENAELHLIESDNEIEKFIQEEGKRENYAQMIAGIRVVSGAIEECIKEDLLTVPENDHCAEGVFMRVEE